MRKLILDFGNTLQKLAVFEGHDMLDETVFSMITPDQVIEYVHRKGPFNASILSAVVDYPSEIKTFLERNMRFVELLDSTPIPITNNYRTPKTLGKDRIAAVVGAAALYPHTNILVIDAGTCITYDLISKTGDYPGGAISPGITMRFKAMNAFTGKLPLIEAEPFGSLVGKSTKESMLSGVMNGTIEEIKGIIMRYQEQFENLSIVITGGDHKYLLSKLKNNIFAVPNLVLRGLNEILEYNEKGS